MGIYEYIGLAVVVGLLIGLVTLSVAWTVRAAARNIRSKSISLLSVYDELLEERSRRLAWADKELTRREEAENAAPEAVPFASDKSRAPVPNFLKDAERLSGTSYQSTGAADAYKLIRQNFAITPGEALMQAPIAQERKTGGPATSLLAKLQFDAVCALSSLPSEEQAALLQSELSGTEAQLLEDYRKTVTKFDAISFYDALKGLASAEPGPVIVRTGRKVSAPLYPGELSLEVDESICEGVEVEADNMLYDYSIKVRELG